jgi:putative ABC transport system ATP-binding protein
MADEPTGDLDAETSEQILDLLLRLNAELGTTLVMVTHDPQAAAVARRRLRLEKGELLEPEPPAVALSHRRA